MGGPRRGARYRPRGRPARWQAIDPLLPDPAVLPNGCGAPLVVNGEHGRIAGLGVCVHHHIPADSLNQTWGAADRFTLVPRLAGQDVAASAGMLLAQWRDHLAGAGAGAGAGPGPGPGPAPGGATGAGAVAARGTDTSATVVWPSQDITGIQALLRHGLQPLTVIAARPRPQAPGGPRFTPRGAYGVLILRRDRPTRSRSSTLSCSSSGTTCTSAGRCGGPRPPGWFVTRSAAASRGGPPGHGWPSARRPRSGPAGRPAARRDGLDRGDGERLPGGVPADDVRRPARTRDGAGSALVRYLHAQLDGTKGGGHAAAPQPGQPAVGAVLVPDGIPAATDKLGSQGRTHALR